MHRRVNWALMLATLASAFALYAIKYDTRRLEVRVQAQERALEKAEIDVAVLTAERAHLARPERLEPLARLLGLAPITNTQYLRLDAMGADAPTREPDPANAASK
jgi:cell division protein FtsL